MCDFFYYKCVRMTHENGTVSLELFESQQIFDCYVNWCRLFSIKLNVSQFGMISIGLTMF